MTAKWSSLRGATATKHLDSHDTILAALRSAISSARSVRLVLTGSPG